MFFHLYIFCSYYFSILNAIITLKGGDYMAINKMALRQICNLSVENSLSIMDVNELITAIKESDDFQASENLKDILTSVISETLFNVLTNLDRH